MTTTSPIPTMTSIEVLWRRLRDASPIATQIRVDAEHPLDIYADFQAPDRVGLFAVCGARPPTIRPMQALAIDEGRRADGRWSLRLALIEIPLLPVFAALCEDIIACSRSGVDQARLGIVIVQRLVHWRSLLERDAAGLGREILQGLVGELLVLRDRLVPQFGPNEAVAAWRGPSGAPQDFILPDGRRLEVKTTTGNGRETLINGLDQLDPGLDRLTLVLVRAQAVTPATPDAVTAPLLVEELRGLAADQPETIVMFEAALAALGWHEHPSHETVALRIIGVDDHEVDCSFPRLIRSTVPTGIVDADYRIALPRAASRPGDAPNDG